MALINDRFWSENFEAEVVEFNIPKFFQALQMEKKYYRPYIIGDIFSTGHDSFILNVQSCSFLTKHKMFSLGQELNLEFYHDGAEFIESGMKASFYFTVKKRVNGYVLFLSKHRRNKFEIESKTKTKEKDFDPVLDYIAKQRKKLDNLERKHLRKKKGLPC